MKKTVLKTTPKIVPKIIFIAGYKFLLWPMAGSMIIIILFILLGNWQLGRLKQKNLFIAQVTANIAAPPVAYADSITAYSKIKLFGHFLSDYDIFLYQRRASTVEKDGYYLVSLFQDIKGNIFLVMRGWLPKTVKDSFARITGSKSVLPQKTVKEKIIGEEINREEVIGEEIIGIALPGEVKPFFVPENDYKNNVWFTLDVNKAAGLMPITVTGFYLLQIEHPDKIIPDQRSENKPQELRHLLKPVSPDYLGKIKNDHLEYALTWYSLAVCLFIFFFVYNKYTLSKHTMYK